MTFDCLRCGSPYTQQRRRASHFCPSCRSEIKRERDRERLSDERRSDTERRRLVEDLIKSGVPADQVIASRRVTGAMVFDPTMIDDVVPDRMPTGANTPRGPDDGCSTNFADLAEMLDQRAREVAAHPWFAANPHWSFELHDDDEAAKYELRAG